MKILEWSITKNRGAKMCAKIISTLIDEFPSLLSEWDYEKNESISPEKVAAKSGKKVWWKCAEGHSWEAAVFARANGSKCPYCTGLYPIIGENDLATTNPEVVVEWDYEKNLILPTQIKSGTNKKVWWKCSAGHCWEASIASRTILKTKCPFCSGLKAIPGENDLATTNPELANEWDYEKNKESIETVKSGSSKKAWWKCPIGHSYEAVISARARLKSGCPYCVGQKPIQGVNDLATLRPDISKEWDNEKNKQLSPSDVNEGSSKKVWWRCSKGHSYEAIIASRTGPNHTGCPYCAGQKVLEGFNDLETVFPNLAQEWCYEKNIGLTPRQITKGYNRKVWWKCSLGHEYEAIIYNRIEGANCPICSNRVCVTGINDLETLFPELAKEWNYKRNKSLLPSQIVPGSGEKVWWSCKHCGYEWKTVVINRSKGGGCPKCNERNKTSFPEQAIFYYVREFYPDAINSYKDIFSDSQMEIDIYIPSLLVGIEYDGMAWHSTPEVREREIRKYNICRENGIKLIRIKENSEHKDEDSSDLLIHTNVKYNTETFVQLFSDMFEFVKIIPDINLERDRITIKEQYYTKLKERSAGVLYPKLNDEWHQTKNGTLTLEMFLPGSTEKVWWICTKCAHEWKTTIQSRVNGTGCPKCAQKIRGKQLVEKRTKNGENTIAKKAPWMILEWNYEKNVDMTPENTPPQSGKKVWWKCAKGHEWEESVQYRFLWKRNCPYCSGRYKDING